jgi:ATP-dependent helicase Lhr and Lhr-like helicase
MIESRIQDWFKQQGWRPFAFQQRVWQAMREQQWGLLHAGTGSGKTLASWLGALQVCESTDELKAGCLKVLWVTPMRALAADTTVTLAESAKDLVPHWRIEMRTADTSASVKARQGKHLPEVLVTTPESLSLLLASTDAQARLQSVQVVVVDEWHELIASKRGVQVQLALARLMRWQPALVCWGMSATLGNLEQALQTLTQPSGQPGLLMCDDMPKAISMDVVLPPKVEQFPWAGHMGLSLVGEVAKRIWQAQTTLVFVNTRAQAERWYQALLEHDSGLAGVLALHHGSLDQSVRHWVEAGLKQGSLRAVVCTSSLDLGVDFLPVEQVMQIGSAKGVARLMQRAGRAGHAPGRSAKLVLVPTHSLEILEAVAAKDAVLKLSIESRSSPVAPMDVLTQHLVTIALGGGFRPAELRAEVQLTHAYRDLSDSDWQWALDFVSGGGKALAAYPDYRRVVAGEDGVWRVPDRQLARRHRMSIGTIVSDAMMQVRVWRKGGAGARLGQLEESFIARLKVGDGFYFAGRLLELVRVQDMTAYVKRTDQKRAVVPRWMGGNMPLSSELAAAMLARLDGEVQDQDPDPDPAWQAMAPLLSTQSRWSALPSSNYLLVEQWQSREGSHLFLYPFAGRHVHMGLAMLLAWRLSRESARTFTMAVNDYGFELLCAQPLAAQEVLSPALFTIDNLQPEILASLNASELSQRRFREIARVAGLVFQGYPGAKKTAKQIQASSGLFFEVFRQYDPSNALLKQAYDEVLSQELEHERLAQTLQRMQSLPLLIKPLERPTPFAFPLLVERLRERLSSEKLSERVARLVRDLEKAIAS